MVSFANFKKLAFPSSMPDNKADAKKDSRGGSALDTNDNASNYKTLSTNRNDVESEEENKGTLKGRKSEEPPDRISYKSKRIDNSNRNEASPDFSTKYNPKIISKNAISKEPSEKPVQNIMKVGNLYMFNVYKNGDGSAPSQNAGKETPVSNIELDPLDFGVSKTLHIIHLTCL